jgi:hypothetical protein
MRICLLVVALSAILIAPAIAQQAPPPANPPRIIQEPPFIPQPPETFGQAVPSPAADQRNRLCDSQRNRIVAASNPQVCDKLRQDLLNPGG